jgi:hypothetical protein
MPRESLKQNYANSCGAVCLLCAAKELGIDKFPNIKPWNGKPLVVNTNCEGDVFKYTGTGKLGTGGKPGTALSDLGYSMPAKLAAVARSLGLQNCNVYMRQGFYATMLSTFYSSAMEDGRGSDIPIVEQEMPGLAWNQRALRVMAVQKVLGLHYVMQRPDGSYMDPGDGQNFDNFGALNASWMKGYADTGIALVVEGDWINLNLWGLFD